MGSELQAPLRQPGEHAGTTFGCRKLLLLGLTLCKIETGAVLLDELDDAAAAAPEAPEDDEDDAEPAPALSSSKFRNEDGCR